LQRLKRENATLREEREILKKAAAWFARETGFDPAMVFEFMKAHQAAHSIPTLCRVLGVSELSAGPAARRRNCGRRRPELPRDSPRPRTTRSISKASTPR
jgi:hypothetical protein